MFWVFGPVVWGCCCHSKWLCVYFFASSLVCVENVTWHFYVWRAVLVLFTCYPGWTWIVCTLKPHSLHRIITHPFIARCWSHRIVSYHWHWHHHAQYTSGAWAGALMQIHSKSILFFMTNCSALGCASNTHNNPSPIIRSRIEFIFYVYYVFLSTYYPHAVCRLLVAIYAYMVCRIKSVSLESNYGAVHWSPFAEDAIRTHDAQACYDFMDDLGSAQRLLGWRKKIVSSSFFHRIFQRWNSFEFSLTIPLMTNWMKNK